MAAIQLDPSRSRVAPTAADMPRVAPTDTSISPVRMTKALPTASNVNTTLSLKQFRMDVGCQKSGFTHPTMNINAARNKKLLISWDLIIFFI